MSNKLIFLTWLTIISCQSATSLVYPVTFLKFPGSTNCFGPKPKPITGTGSVLVKYAKKYTTDASKFAKLIKNFKPILNTTEFENMVQYAEERGVILEGTLNTSHYQLFLKNL